MKKTAVFYFIFLSIFLCGCDSEESQTRFMLDTAVTLTADCERQTLNGAFELCDKYEKMLSRTVEGSDVYRINSTDGFCEVDSETVDIIRRSVYYSEKTDGKFDITVCAVSELWDFENQIVPSRSEIAEALKSVDYGSINIDGNSVCANGKRIDLGGIAKGYIADRIKAYFLENGVKNGIVNLGGNTLVFGNKTYNVGIIKPFSDDIIAVLSLKNKSAVTSGIYQRYIEADGEIYHHIIDPETGCGVKNGLASVTVIGDCSLDCDALSTCCMLLGAKKGKELIEDTPDTEAVFIGKDEKITLTDGLYEKNGLIYLK